MMESEVAPAFKHSRAQQKEAREGLWTRIRKKRDIGGPDGEVLLRPAEVSAVIGLSQSTLYRMQSAGEFPRPLTPTARAKLWPMSVVQTWIKDRMQESGYHVD